MTNNRLRGYFQNSKRFQSGEVMKMIPMREGVVIEFKDQQSIRVVLCLCTIYAFLSHNRFGAAEMF